MKSNALCVWAAAGVFILCGASGYGLATCAAQSLPTSPASEPATAPAMPLEAPNTTVFILAGIVVLAWFWLLLARPNQVSLANAAPRPNMLSPVLPAVILLLWVAVQGLAGVLLMMAYGIQSIKDLPKDDPRALQITLITATIAGAFMTAAVLVTARRAFARGWTGMGLTASHWLGDLGRAVGFYLLVIPVCKALLEAANYCLRPWPSLTPTHDILVAVTSLSPGWQSLAVLAAGILAPLSEELFFRGLVQTLLRRYVRSPWAAVLITSAAFASMHWQYLNTVPALFVLGVVLGYLYERTGRLTPCILLHAVFNNVSLAATLLNLPQ